MKKYVTLPNIITSLRIVGTILLFFIHPFTVAFYMIYTFCGVTDVLDGFIARRTNSISEFGSKLDSIADLLFYSIMIIKIFPKLLEVLPMQVWYMVAGVLIIRSAAYLLAAIKYRKFASLHTYMNKVTGLVVFSIPYFIREPYAVMVCKVIAIIAGTAALEELIMHIVRKEYKPGVKTILHI